MKNSFLISLGLLCIQASLGYSISLKEQNELLFQQIQKTHNPTAEQMKKIKSIFQKSGYISQGNPEVTKHPITTKQCLDKLNKAKISYDNANHEKICGDKYMAPLYHSKNEKPKNANTCIDKFEFPNIPCDYPVVWVRANEAAQICDAMGKRLCDAHEWESACDGSLREPDYDFSLMKSMKTNAAIKKMRYAHNAKERKNKTWSYGKTRKKGICGMSSSKDKGCNGGNWKKCGSNTYPVGSFPECKSSLDVYDIHGNAAEHMNLPLSPDQMAGHSSKQLGYTEMKGSWFIFDKYKAHKDYCRWRAPFWHGTKVNHPKSHHNYHLGFRCCKTVKN